MTPHLIWRLALPAAIGVRALVCSVADQEVRVLVVDDVDLGRRAPCSGVIKGILLHQGESNSGEPDRAARVGMGCEDLLHDPDLRAGEGL